MKHNEPQLAKTTISFFNESAIVNKEPAEVVEQKTLDKTRGLSIFNMSNYNRID